MPCIHDKPTWEKDGECTHPVCSHARTLKGLEANANKPAGWDEPDRLNREHANREPVPANPPSSGVSDAYEVVKAALEELLNQHQSNEQYQIAINGMAALEKTLMPHLKPVPANPPSLGVTDAPGWTPGPWTYAPIPGYQYVVEIEKASQVFLCAGHVPPGREAEIRANAQLASAAPDLYAALNGLVHEYHPFASIYWEKAEAALAKARGEKPNEGEKPNAE